MRWTIYLLKVDERTHVKNTIEKIKTEFKDLSSKVYQTSKYAGKQAVTNKENVRRHGQKYRAISAVLYLWRGWPPMIAQFIVGLISMTVRYYRSR